MQSVFIKTNWPGEIRKDPTVVFLVFVVAHTVPPISTFPFQLDAQKWQTVRKPCDKPASLNQNNSIHQESKSTGICLVDTVAGKQ